jgi:hypothetical protein
LVGVALAASVAYAVYSLGPRSLRARLLAGTAALLGHLPKFFGLGGAVRRLEGAAVARKSTGSCGGCDNCGSEATPAAPSSAPTEVNVPVSRIGKRTVG